MKLFDMHSDIGTDIFRRTETFQERHLDKLRKGGIGGVFTACFFNGKEDWETMQKMVLNCEKQLSIKDEKHDFVTCSKDLLDTDKLITMISVEGMCGIKENAKESIDWLYEHGVRVGSLVWNEQNALAAGWKRDPMYGVTELGKEAIKEMNKLHMVIDVSHINEKGFWDVLENSTRPVIATHSNARRLCDHERNLTDQQIKAIAQKGGVIGMNAASDFVSLNRSEQDVLHLAKHARYIADLVGVKYVGCGFDFMDFLDGFEDDEMTRDMTTCLDAQRFPEALRKEGFTEEEIADICFYNVYNFLKENID